MRITRACRLACVRSQRRRWSGSARPARAMSRCARHLPAGSARGRALASARKRLPRLAGDLPIIARNRPPRLAQVRPRHPEHVRYACDRRHRQRSLENSDGTATGHPPHGELAAGRANRQPNPPASSPWRHAPILGPGTGRRPCRPACSNPMIRILDRPGAFKHETGRNAMSGVRCAAPCSSRRLAGGQGSTSARCRSGPRDNGVRGQTG